MALIIKDRIRDTTTTTGTGAVTVSGTAASGYKTFSAVMSVSDTTYLCIAHQSADEWEVSVATYSAANVLTRTTVLAGTNGTSAVNFSAGTKDVFITLAADKQVFTDATQTLTNKTLTSPIETSPSVSGTVAYASGTILNFNAGDVTITHSANALTFDGAASGYTFNNHVFVKSGKPWVDVMAHNADPTGATDSTAAFNAAIAAAQAVATVLGATVYVPPGQYLLASGITIPAKVELIGAGMGCTTLFAWHTDVTVVTLNGQYAGIDGFQIYGKGENADTGTFGASATTYALHVSSATDGYVRRVKVAGGYYAINIDSVDCTFSDVIATSAYGPALVRANGANWFYRMKWDHAVNSVSVGARSWAARANTTAYVIGDTRTATGPDAQTWGIVCVQNGTSGGSAPTLLNYGRQITDGTVLWELVAPVTYSGVIFTGGAVGEDAFFQLDLSGPYENAITLDDDGAGTSLISITNCICAAPVSILSGQQIMIQHSELTGVTVDTGYTGRCMIHDNMHAGSAWNITIGANVNDFSIIGNHLEGGTITVAAGTSTRYSIIGNVNATVNNGGTGTNKIIIGTGGSEVPGNVQPVSNDGGALGSGTASWSDLFLASGGVINFNNGDMTITHSADTLTFAGGTLVLPASCTGYPPMTRQIITATGTWTRPTNCKRVRAIAVGGGGGGAGSANASASQVAYGTSGGGGGYAEIWLDVTAISSVSVTVGAAGAGGASGANNGTAGGSSSFGTHAVAGGGSGGVTAASGTSVVQSNGAAGGVPTAGDIQINGEQGGPFVRLSGTSAFMFCNGGNSGHAMGTGGGAPAFNASGNAGTGYGAGGSGCSSSNAGGAQAGGAGTAGVVIVEEHY